MALVADYSSDEAKEDQILDQGGVVLAADRDNSDEGADSQDSYFMASDSESEDSASRRKRLADDKLTNNSDEVSGPASLDLPPPLEVIGGTKAPDFLRPEATKQLAKPFHRSRAPLTKAVEHKAVELPKAWDIASMAPKLKGEGDKRGPPGAVITAAAKRNKIDDEDEGGVTFTAAQVAMLGGQWRPSSQAQPEQEGGPMSSAVAKKRGPTKAMPVSDFLAKGEGGSQLPRAKQDRKDREKEKRARGQSSVHGWKSEAEMVLRQQYD